LPVLVDLYSAQAPAGGVDRGVGAIDKATVTFSDALQAVRRWLWAEGVFRQADRD
jgi:hypothetical protein